MESRTFRKVNSAREITVKGDETLIDKLWESTRGSERIFAPRSVVEPVLSSQQRQHILYTLHQLPNGGIHLGGNNNNSMEKGAAANHPGVGIRRTSTSTDRRYDGGVGVRDFRDLITATIGLTLTMSDEEVADLLFEHVRPNGNVPEESILELASMLRRRSIMFEGDMVEIPQSLLPPAEVLSMEASLAIPSPPSPKNILVSRRGRGVSLILESQQQQPSGTPKGKHCQQRRRSQTTPSISFLKPTLLPEPPQSATAGLMSTPSQFEAGSHHGALTDMEMARLRLSQRVFSELGGDFADPTSMIPVTRANRFITRMLSNCGESDVSIEHYVAQFERVYDRLSFSDFDREVVEPIFLRLPKRFRDGLKKAPSQVQGEISAAHHLQAAITTHPVLTEAAAGDQVGSKKEGNNNRRRKSRRSISAAGGDRKHGDVKTNETARALMQDSTFIAERSLFKSVQKLLQKETTTKDLNKQLEQVKTDCIARNKVHRHIMKNADEIFASRCTLEGTGLLHLATLRPLLLQRYVTHLNNRRRLTVRRMNVVMARIAKTLSAALSLIYDHSSRCTYCKGTKMLNIVAQKEAKSEQVEERKRLLAAQAGASPPRSIKERNRVRGQEAADAESEKDKELIDALAKCRSITEKVKLVFQQSTQQPHSSKAKGSSNNGRGNHRSRSPMRSPAAPSHMPATCRAPRPPSVSNWEHDQEQRHLSTHALNGWVRSMKVRAEHREVDRQRELYPDFRH